jgi:hypothetical protein
MKKILIPPAQLYIHLLYKNDYFNFANKYFYSNK